VTAPKAMAIVGFSNCGKTELICKLIALARERGFQVAAIKHSHKILEVDQPGKDTWRLRQAGATSVALAAPGLLQVTYTPPEDLPAPAVLAALPAKADLVLIEGYKHGPWPKMVFVPPPAPGTPLPDYENSVAYITEAAVDTPLPVFSRHQIPEILDFILQWLQV
jgi:molybdopterin-guanine dinucleotide biosynthesis adapter protein